MAVKNYKSWPINHPPKVACFLQGAYPTFLVVGRAENPHDGGHEGERNKGVNMAEIITLGILVAVCVVPYAYSYIRDYFYFKDVWHK